MDSFLRIAIRPAIVYTALKVSCVVGTILNIINQWHALFGDAQVSWVHVIMNYVVPYCVSTYSATRIAQRG